MIKTSIKANTSEDKLNAWFDLYVPDIGKAGTIGGEIVRAISQINYRWFNDGDQIGCGYGKETCNPAARFLIANCDSVIKDDILDMWGETFFELPEFKYNSCLYSLQSDVCDFLDANPELFEVANPNDMWDYKNPEEDSDDSYDEDEDEEDYDEEDEEDYDWEDEEDWY